MKKWRVTFEENGGEYWGFVVITAQALAQVEVRALIADGVTIEFGEDIVLVEAL